MITAVLAFAAGAVIAWVIASAVAKSQTAAAEARVGELRTQVDAARQGFDGLRAKLEESERAKVAAETRAADIATRVAEQQALLDDAKAKLTDTFKALASEVLATNNKGFLTLAGEKFKALQESADTELASRQEAIDALVKPLEKALTDYQQEARQLEQLRQKELGSVGRQLTDVAAAQLALQQETARLVGALSSAQIRGRWGEVSLRRCAELAGMSSFCDFDEQVTRVTEDGRLRPDMIVRMPAGRQVIVDSKVPMVGYDEWRQAESEPARETALGRHVTCILQHVSQLASREYWEPFQSAEFVVLFIPNDTFLAAATQKDPGLVEAAMQKRVVFATPSTLYGLLRAVEYGWRQQHLADNARRINQVGRELCDRIAKFVEHLETIGAALAKATKSYRLAAGSYHQYLLPKARQFTQLGAGGKKEIKELPVLEAPDESPETPAMTETSGAVVESREELP
ncbi:MAG: DNA recombination protein RmuC [Candidatus Omnitrophica bacterium]|nr:DNA recombination protein RmuC [Candidatus Omnitrophota bacterium]